jgi:hypothetical protein
MDCARRGDRVVRGRDGLQGIDGDGAADGGAVRSNAVFGSLKQALSTRWRFYVACDDVAAARQLLWTGPRIHSAGFSSGISPWTHSQSNRDDRAPAPRRLAKRARVELRLA